MHGAGNDFVVIDARESKLELNATTIAALADRHTGIGCDQLVMIEPPQAGGDLFMRLYNQDGGQVGACGNAARCIGWWYLRQTKGGKAAIETNSGLVEAVRSADGRITVDMGAPKLQAPDIPLSESRNIEHLGIAEGPLMDPMAVNMGNPHMVFFVPDIDKIDMAKHGAKMEHHPLFPEKCNVSAVEVICESEVRQVVWERGAGLTLACGTAACSAVVAGVTRGLLARNVEVHLPGGILGIFWNPETGHVEMTGPVAIVFEGRFTS